MENTTIQWATHSWSPWIGCSRVHTGCDHCYAEAQAGRFAVTWGPDGQRRKTSDSYWRRPLKWEREAQQFEHWANWQRPRIFPSLCDPFEDWHLPMLHHGGQRLLVADEEPGRYLPQPTAEQFENCTATEKQNLRSGVYRHVWMDDLRRDMFALIDQTPNLDWLLLTKRPENVRRMWPPRIVANDYPVLGWPRLGFPTHVLAAHDRQAQINHGQSLEQLRTRGGLSAQEMLAVLEDRTYQPIEGGEAAAVDLLCTHRADEMKRRPNVWLIYSASDQATIEAGLPHLLACRDRVPVLGLSLEPLVGPIDLRLDDCWLPGDHYDLGDRLDWVIVGGESGSHARPCNIDWIRSIRNQCAEAGVPCFVKQLGSLPVMDYYGEEGLRERCLESDARVFEPTRDGWAQWDWRRDKYQPRPGTVLEIPLRDRKGGDPSEWPEDLRIRQFPSTT